MTGWTPLFQQIIGSSIWSTPNHIRIAWVTMLATADKHGVCALTVGGLSALARISRQEAEEAFLVLSSPDADTLTQKNEGRRIVRVENGWKLLNWEDYREKAKRAVIQEHNREAQARWRQNNPVKATPEQNDLLDPVDDQAEQVYELYPKKVRKPKAIVSIRNAIKQFGFELIRQKTVEFAKARQGQNDQFTPHPATWFNQHGFNDEPSTWNQNQDGESGDDLNDPTVVSNWARQQ